MNKRQIVALEQILVLAKSIKTSTPVQKETIIMITKLIDDIYYEDNLENKAGKLDVKVRVWLLEFESMLKTQALETNIPLVKRKKAEKAKEVRNFLNESI